MRNERGFTLIEMLIVMLIITVLLFIAIPNIIKHSASVHKKGCEAYIHMVKGQVQAYQVEKNTKTVPTLDKLVSEGYVTHKTCPNGKKIEIDKNGNVREKK